MPKYNGFKNVSRPLELLINEALTLGKVWTLCSWEHLSSISFRQFFLLFKTCSHKILDKEVERNRGEIGKTTDFVHRNIADMQKSFELQSGFVSRARLIKSSRKVSIKNILLTCNFQHLQNLPCQSYPDRSGNRKTPVICWISGEVGEKKKK